MNDEKDRNLNNAQKKCIIIFSGFNQRAIIAFLRTLKKNNLDYVIIAKSENDDIFLTDYKCCVLAIRKLVSLNLKDLVGSIKEVQRKHKADEYIIAPTTEALNRFLLQNREDFENHRCKIPLVDKNLYELISDKYSFGKLCSQHKILVPKEVDFNIESKFPFVAKPKNYFSTITGEVLSPVILNNSYEIEKFLEKYKIKDFYFQDFINGKSIYLLYYFHRDGTIFKFSQENLIQQPGGKSMVAAISSDYHNSTESNKYEKLFKGLKFFGFLMVEIKQDHDKNYMIEANPRFWGPSQLFVDSEINLFEAFLHDFGLINSLREFKEPLKIVRYFWFGGVCEILKKNLKLTYHRNNEDELINLLHEWLKYDIYRRADTKSVFKKELFQ